MLFPGSDYAGPGGKNAGPESDILWPELMSEGKETLLELKKVNRTMWSNFILSIIFVSEWTLSLCDDLMGFLYFLPHPSFKNYLNLMYSM